MANEYRFGEEVTLKEAINQLYKDHGEVGLDIKPKGNEVIVKPRRDKPCQCWERLLDLQDARKTPVI